MSGCCAYTFKSSNQSSARLLLGGALLRHALGHAGEIDVLAVAVRLSLVPSVSLLHAVLHRFPVTLKLALVGHLTLNQTEVGHHLDRVERARDERKEKRDDGADADDERDRDHLERTGVFRAEEITSVRRGGHRQEAERGRGRRERSRVSAFRRVRRNLRERASERNQILFVSLAIHRPPPRPSLLVRFFTTPF